MQSFTTDIDLSCSIRYIHSPLKIVSAKALMVLDAVYTFIRVYVDVCLGFAL